MSEYKPSASEIKELRTKTLAGFQNCKDALAEANGDMTTAVEIIRKKGLTIAAKKAHREASEGLIVATISDDMSAGAMVELNCESDFVAKNEAFQDLAGRIAGYIVRKGADGIADGAHLYDSIIENGKSVKLLINELIGKIGENMGLKRTARFSVDGPGIVHTYIHPPGKVGVLVQLACASGDDVVRCSLLAHEIALQIAFSDPGYIAPEDIPENVLAKEREIAEGKAREQGKPDHLVPKIAEGILRKYYSEECLMELPYAKDPNLKVRDIIKQSGISGAEVKKFVRFALK